MITFEKEETNVLCFLHHIEVSFNLLWLAIICEVPASLFLLGSCGGKCRDKNWSRPHSSAAGQSR